MAVVYPQRWLSPWLFSIPASLECRDHSGFCSGVASPGHLLQRALENLLGTNLFPIREALFAVLYNRISPPMVEVGQVCSVYYKNQFPPSSSSAAKKAPALQHPPDSSLWPLWSLGSQGEPRQTGSWDCLPHCVQCIPWSLTPGSHSVSQNP